MNAGRKGRERRRGDGDGKIMDLPLIARVLSMRRMLRARERWAAESVSAHRQEQLRALRAHAQAHSPFYRRFHAGSESKPLNELPVLTKSELMSSFDELVTDRAVHLASVRTHFDALKGDELFLKKYRVTRTSGSTGHPSLFLSDPWEWANIIASYSRAQEWRASWLESRAALDSLLSALEFRGISPRVSVQASTARSCRFDASIRPSLWRPSVTGLNDWQPENLIAYASMARVLAEEQLSGRLRISPRAVMSASEVLTRESRIRIERAWGHQPFDVYAATEKRQRSPQSARGIASICSKTSSSWKS
jgi:phenylacetate-CoA ligase